MTPGDNRQRPRVSRPAAQHGGDGPGADWAGLGLAATREHA